MRETRNEHTGLSLQQKGCIPVVAQLGMDVVTGLVTCTVCWARPQLNSPRLLCLPQTPPPQTFILSTASQWLEPVLRDCARVSEQPLLKHYYVIPVAGKPPSKALLYLHVSKINCSALEV